MLISAKAFDELENQPDVLTQGLGQFNFENVKRPVDVYALSNDGLEVPEDATMQPLRAGTAKSIAVLPFVNRTSD